jgi:hypothetical protein
MKLPAEASAAAVAFMRADSPDKVRGGGGEGRGEEWRGGERRGEGRGGEANNKA